MSGQAERVMELRKLAGDRRQNPLSKIFALTSGKGGTGKTFLSLNLAYSLAAAGSRVLVIDLDSNLSNSNIMLNVIAAKTIYGFYTEQKLLSDLITEYEPNIHFIFGDSGRLNYPSPKSGLISKMFSQLRNLEDSYDFIFLDTGAGAGEDILSILLKADGNIIVTLPEPTAVMDSYVMLKLLSGNRYCGKKYIVVNKCFEVEDGKATFDNLTMAADHFLKDKPAYLGEVSFDKSVIKSIVSQELFLKGYSGTPVAAQIERIAGRLYEFNHVANILQPQASSAL